ncbi:MAG: VWA domain-containing protein, partial [Oscillospiraceae bacterium]
MKRKLKVFLNNRVISTAISAAITFNMAALFPMCVFAKDDDSTHTNTVDFSEIKIDGKVMSNGYIAFNVENNGHFAIGTTGGDPDNSKDNNKKMLFGFSSGSTSYSTLRVDGTSYTIYASNNSFNADEANNVSEATYNDVNVQQVLSLTDNPATGRADLIEIRYVVTNESETEKNVGLRIMMDTMLGDNDSAPFRIPQYGAITTETEYTGDEIPQFWQAFDNLTSPSVVAQGRLYQIEEDKPDKVQFCNWRGLSNCNWEYTVHPGSGNGDSGVAMTWYEAPLAPYESKTYVTYYGLSEFSEDMSLPLGLSVYSDSELSVINSQYAPNPVDVTAYVQNLSSSTAEDVKVSIELPDGLQLTNNTEQTIDVGNMTPNQLEQTAWSVFVNPSNQEQTYEYTVVLTAADGYEKRVSRRIHVPALKIEEVSPYTLFSGSSTENFQLNCWKSTFNGNVYTGASFVSNASELYLNGKVDAVNTITTNGWQININERNENVDKEAMPDWDARIHKMAGAYEFTDEDVVRIQDKNVMDGAVKTTGKAEISGTTFDGNCYIIADGDITYNVNDFISTGRVVLYSRNGNITINGTNIDMNGIMYAPNGTVAFNSNIANINGRIFADKINFSGSIFNVTGSDSDWELLGTKSVISKTYTLDDDFKEGEFDGLGLDVADELTLDQRSDNDNVSSENSYKIDSAANGIGMTVKSDKSSLDKPEDSVNLEFDLGGFGSQEIEENNVDLAIVVDTSGSMGGSRKTNAQNAAREVVAQMKENDRCAIIKFTSSATVLQDFTDDYELLDTAINKLGASGGTNIASGINKAISCFGNLEDNSRQKYIILLSDGSDSSKSAQAASDAYALGIRIFALSIGNDSNQMQTVAANSNGIYLNSPTAEQINEMMQQFAAEVFDTAGKDVSFEMTVSKKAGIDASAINPQPTEIIENEDGTKTLKWSYEKISIDENQIITVPVSVNDLKAGLFNIADNVSCTYFNRNGKSSTVYADDIVMPVHSYKESGVWTAVYDSKTVDTVWKNIYWNGKLYDDGKIVVKACAGNDENAFGDWVDITNYADIENL